MSFKEKQKSIRFIKIRFKTYLSTEEVIWEAMVKVVAGVADSTAKKRHSGECLFFID